MEDQARYQDVIGQFPQLKTYNHGLFCFPVENESSRNEIVEALAAAWDKVTSSIPWLKEQVINKDKKPGDSGYFTTAPWPSDVPSDPKSRIYVKDCSDICPSYPELLKAGAPVSMLDGSILCPFPGFPLSYEEAKIGPAPPVAIQANFIKGGVLLNFSNQHNVMDATGLFTFIMLIAAAMRGEGLPEKIVEAANLDRRGVIPLLPPGEPMKNHDHLRRPPAPALPTPAQTPPPQARPSYKWAYWRIPKTKIAEIKALATPPPPHPSSTSSSPSDQQPSKNFISTNDALSAFYWSRLAHIRLSLTPSLLLPQENGKEKKWKFSRAIDTRFTLHTPAGYMGQMVYQSASFLTLYSQSIDTADRAQPDVGPNQACSPPQSVACPACLGVLQSPEQAPTIIPASMLAGLPEPEGNAGEWKGCDLGSAEALAACVRQEGHVPTDIGLDITIPAATATRQLSLLHHLRSKFAAQGLYTNPNQYQELVDLKDAMKLTVGNPVAAHLGVQCNKEGTLRVLLAYLHPASSSETDFLFPAGHGKGRGYKRKRGQPKADLHLRQLHSRPCALASQA